MAVTAALIAGGISAAGALGSAAISAGRSPAEGNTNQALQYQALQDAQNNAAYQRAVDALINTRSVAGQTDAFGSSVQYDPATNTWQSTLGKLPMAAQTAAQQAAISRNTTDLRAAQFANQQAALRATMAGPAADAARRNLETFRPMTADALTGLLGQQATLAQQQTFRPMIADTLRQFARTGTSAGPVLGQIGRDEATNLRQSLMDAQIKGMTGVTDINNANRQGLEGAATTTSALTNPQLQFSGLSGSGGDNTMNQVISQRAAAAGTAPAYGMSALNQATGETIGAFGNAGKNLSDPNFGLNAADNSLKQLTTMFGPGGSGKALVDVLTGNSSNTANAGDQGGWTPQPKTATPTQPYGGGNNYNY